MFEEQDKEAQEFTKQLAGKWIVECLTPSDKEGEPPLILARKFSNVVYYPCLLDWEPGIKFSIRCLSIKGDGSEKTLISRIKGEELEKLVRDGVLFTNDWALPYIISVVEEKEGKRILRREMEIRREISEIEGKRRWWQKFPRKKDEL